MSPRPCAAAHDHGGGPRSSNRELARIFNEIADILEGIVADDMWPLPKYQEMLFVR
jgi:glutamine synthetase